MLQESPSLIAAWHEMIDRLSDIATEAMAARAGVDPEEPEPRIAAEAILNLWKVQFRAMMRYADGTRTPEQMRGRPS